MTKTEQVVNHLQNGNLTEALKIASTFKMGFTQEEQKILKRAHEMTWNSTFYKMLGYDKDMELRKAGEILENYYLGGN